MKRITLFAIILIIVTLSTVIYAEDRVSLGFIYDTSNPVDLVTRTNGGINQVSPLYFDITSKGNLDLNNVSIEFIDKMHDMGIDVLPFLSNHWSRSKGRKAINNAEKLSNQIVEAIKKYNLDGINVDIENLNEKDKDALSNFVKILREKLPSDKKVTVSVAANPEGLEILWQGSYDYSTLAKYSDYIFIMTYDEHSQGGASGPVASIDFVEKSIEYALKYVSKDKIVIGIPFYGRFWMKNADNGGEAVVIGDLPRIISKYRGKVKYDKNTKTPNVTFAINDSQTLKINGNKLSSGTYVIYYENEESIKEKLAVVNKYNLLGTGIWALGQENENVWSYYKDALNETPYRDSKLIKIESQFASLAGLNIEETIKIENMDIQGTVLNLNEVLNIIDINRYAHLKAVDYNDVEYIEVIEKILDKYKIKENIYKDIQEIFLDRIKNVDPN